MKLLKEFGRELDVTKQRNRNLKTDAGIYKDRVKNFMEKGTKPMGSLEITLNKIDYFCGQKEKRTRQ